MSRSKSTRRLEVEIIFTDPRTTEGIDTFLRELLQDGFFSEPVDGQEIIQRQGGNYQRKVVLRPKSIATGEGDYKVTYLPDVPIIEALSRFAQENASVVSYTLRELTVLASYERRAAAATSLPQSRSAPYGHS
ncbi:hypothetical protein HY488_02575 [Candidatus Woesearchaeota archaeon]|nr:hypothetical protein [Candidatus Woesearchaeota archaeon]